MPSLNPVAALPDVLAFSGARICPCAARTPLAVRFGLRSPTRPVFEGRWCCRPACVEVAVAAAVRREWGRSVRGRAHSHRVPLGLILLSKGLLTQRQLQEVLLLQKEEGGRLGDLLLRQGTVEERAITEALSTQWNCPIWAIRGFNPSRMARLAPREVFSVAGMVPVRDVGDERLYVTFSGGIDAGAALALERMHQMRVECGVSADSEVKDAQQRLSSATYTNTDYEPFLNEADLVRKIAGLLLRSEPAEARLVRVHTQVWLRMWLEPAALLSPLVSEDVVDTLFTPVQGTA